MSDTVRRTYVISDLHLGGVYAKDPASGDRGFRICTRAPDVAAFVDALTALPRGGDGGAPVVELIVNGDLVDFLAEADDPPPNAAPAAPPTWSPFTADPDAAVRKLEAIVARDHVVFDALARFLAAGHRLVLLLGNHDVELALPPVRAALARLLGVGPESDYTFIHDGEAYLVGDALVEHGNRYDSFNVVDQGALRELRSVMSRRQSLPDGGAFDPPAGSRMVATVINPIKEQYRFIDLLKPETGAVVPVLLALEPGYRSVLSRVASIVAQARDHRMAAPAVPASSGDRGIGPMPGSPMASGPMPGGSMGRGPLGPTAVGSYTSEQEPLERLLDEQLGDAAEEFRTAMRATEPTAGTTARGIDARGFGGGMFARATEGLAERVDEGLGLLRLLTARRGADVDARLPALLAALRALQKDQSFDEKVETEATYIDAAKALAANGIRHVVFGHTHLPKSIPLPGGGLYLNSGTWADVMQLPSDVLSGARDVAMSALRDLVGRIEGNDFSSYTLFRPTYVRIDLDADGRATPELCHWTAGSAP